MLQIEFFGKFVEVYYFRGEIGQFIGQFHQDDYGKAIRKKAGKFARKFARKNGGLTVVKLDHTKKEEA